MKKTLAVLLLLALPVLADPKVVVLADSGGESIAGALKDVGLEATVAHSAQDLESGPQDAVLIAVGNVSDVALKSRLNNKILVDPILEQSALTAGNLLLIPKEGQEAYSQLLAARVRGSEVKALPNPQEGLTKKDDPVQKAVRRFVFAHSGETPVGLANTTYVQSPNWDVRNADGQLDTVVVHATVINDMAGTQRAFLDAKDRRVSAHYVVDRDGTIVQMVDERCAAWHAGVSELDGKEGVNAFSVGVELINLNDGRDPYTDAQYAALVKIIKDLRTRHDVPNSRIVSHAQIARPEGRKTDPLGFDFKKLMEMLE